MCRGLNRETPTGFDIDDPHRGKGLAEGTAMVAALGGGGGGGGVGGGGGGSAEDEIGQVF